MILAHGQKSMVSIYILLFVFDVLCFSDGDSAFHSKRYNKVCNL